MNPPGGLIAVTVLTPPTAPGRWATALVLGIASAMIASWLPHYLTWPWWPDLDAWATIAQGWDAGVLPYRDVVIFNFPGQIYLASILGKTFGWGHTSPFYAVDAGLLMTLGGLLAAWSCRRFGTALPGLIGWVASLAIYLNLDYSMVAQRDWQGPLLAISAILVLQGWTRRWGLAVSAFLMASGFAIRPHVVLFLPAVASVFWLDREGRSRRGRVVAMVAWGLAFAVGVAIAFAPLIFQGLLGDFVRGVRQASRASGYGGGTNPPLARAMLSQIGLFEPSLAFSSRAALASRLPGWRLLATLLALIPLAASERGRTARPWVVALGMVLLYAPLHPKPHAYLVLPSRLTWAVSFAALAGLVFDRLQGRPKAATLAFAAFLIAAVPGVPAFCLPGESFEVLTGRNSARVPATARAHFAPEDGRSPYRWEDYRAAIAYLRANTGPETRVANMLRNVPFPAVNGVTGRISPFPAESGIIWLWSVDPDMEGEFVTALDRSPGDTVAVGSPSEKRFADRLRMKELRDAIDRGFHFEAGFGAIQVWRKNSVADPGRAR